VRYTVRAAERRNPRLVNPSLRQLWFPVAGPEL
jgi:hypothetical protein